MKNPPVTRQTHGFTLIELLAVIGIIAVMMSVAAVGIQNIDRGQATISGVTQVEALMEEARNLAVGRGTKARLCIHADPGETDRYLRFAVVAFEEIVRNESGEEVNRRWKVPSRGTFLPNGVLFHPSFSQDAASRVQGLGNYGDRDVAITFPGEGSRNPNYFYWEFNSEGLCVRDGEADPGAAFVLCRGVITPGTTDPRVIGNDVAGFIVWRNGRTSSIRDTTFVTRG
ncbi:MAG: prepilin-type N-terminal cleavage/methylation domain-containing protein [Verrucomicrobiota bacterium]